MASGRVLNNPSSGVEPHFEFIYEVLEKISEVMQAGPDRKLELAKLERCVKLFYIGPPNDIGEPIQGPDKVVGLEIASITPLTIIFSRISTLPSSKLTKLTG